MNLLDTSRGRKILFAALYLSEGAPVGYIWWALPTQMRSAGVPVAEITTLTSLLILPWILKALWAPVVDAAQGRGWSLREWILSAQILMGLALIPVAFLDMASDYGLIAASLLLHALAASIQDASIDALAISTVPPAQRGSLNGWMQTGYLAGRSVFGGLLLVLSARIGGPGLVIALALTIWGIALILVFLTKLPPTVRPAESAAERFRVYREHFGSMIKTRKVWIALGFALFSGAAFEGVGAVGGPYLIDRGLSQSDVGWVFSIPAVAGMICGALAGGYFTDRFGTFRSVGYSLLSLAAVVCCLAGTDVLPEPPGTGWTVGLFTLLYFCIGIFTASTYTMFMNYTDPRLGATQFSAYMGATNGCESWSGFVTGRIVGASGYWPAFLVLAGISLLTLPLLSRLHGKGNGVRPSP